VRSGFGITFVPPKANGSKGVCFRAMLKMSFDTMSCESSPDVELAATSADNACFATPST
jgi:hypothetical protein